MNPLNLVQKLLEKTPHKAYLFGSRALGKAHPTSDWDIVIVGNERINPILLMGIEEAIENANFLQKVDLVDMYTASTPLKQEIEKTIGKSPDAAVGAGVSQSVSR